MDIWMGCSRLVEPLSYELKELGDDDKARMLGTFGFCISKSLMNALPRRCVIK